MIKYQLVLCFFSLNSVCPDSMFARCCYHCRLFLRAPAFCVAVRWGTRGSTPSTRSSPEYGLFDQSVIEQGFVRVFFWKLYLINFCKYIISVSNVIWVQQTKLRFSTIMVWDVSPCRPCTFCVPRYFTWTWFVFYFTESYSCFLCLNAFYPQCSIALYTPVMRF